MKLVLLVFALLATSTIFGQSLDDLDQVRTTDDIVSSDVPHNGPIKEVAQSDVVPTLDPQVVIDFEGLKDDELEFASRGEVSLENETAISISVYPNPTSNVLVLELTALEKGASISIMDMNGRLVEIVEIERSSHQANLRLNIAAWTAGSYFVVYEKADRKEVVRFQKI